MCLEMLKPLNPFNQTTTTTITKGPIFHTQKANEKLSCRARENTQQHEFCFSK